MAIRGIKLEPFEVVSTTDPALQRAPGGTDHPATRKYRLSRDLADLAPAIVAGEEPAKFKVRPLTQAQRVWVEQFTGTRAHLEALRLALMSASGVTRAEGDVWAPRRSATAFKNEKGEDLDAVDLESMAELEAIVGAGVVDEIGEVVLDEAYLRGVPTSQRRFGQRRG